MEVIIMKNAGVSSRLAFTGLMFTSKLFQVVTNNSKPLVPTLTIFSITHFVKVENYLKN